MKNLSLGLEVSKIFSMINMGCHPSNWRTHIFQDGHIAPPTSCDFTMKSGALAMKNGDWINKTCGFNKTNSCSNKNLGVSNKNWRNEDEWGWYGGYLN